MTTLYEFRDDVGKTEYGTYLTTDSQGRFVLEVKGSGAVKALPEDELTEVVPYTFEVIFSGGNGKRYAFQGTAGSVKVGDILIRDSEYSPNRYEMVDGLSVCKVVAVDTKNKAATKRFDGSKLTTEKLNDK